MPAKLYGDRRPHDVRRWQNVGSPPPAGGIGPPCGRCGISTWVEIGGGGDPAANHPNLDIRKIAGVDIVWNLESGTLPWHDQHATRIRCVHTIEHLSHAAGQSMLREAHRVLHPGGQLYLMVCDTAFILERLREEGLVWWWLTSLYHEEFPTEGGFHKWAYDWPTIKTELEDAGFIDVREAGRYNQWDLGLYAIKPATAGHRASAPGPATA